MALTIEEIKKLQSEGVYIIATHDGTPHADDVFGCTLLRLLKEERGKNNVRIVRTKDPEIINIANATVDVGRVCDPGFEKFDHHQEGGAGKRENQIPFASFGLVWRFHGMVYVRKYLETKGYAKISNLDYHEVYTNLWNRIDQELVSPIDAYDCGYEVESTFNLGELFAFLRPTFLEKEIKTAKHADRVFDELSSIAELVIKRYIANFNSEYEIEKRVRKAQREEGLDKTSLVLNFPIRMSQLEPVLKKYFSRIRIVIIDQNPKKGDTWTINIPKGSHAKFPKQWLGKSGEEFAKACGFADVSFCHPEGFTLTCSSKETAIALAQMCK